MEQNNKQTNSDEIDITSIFRWIRKGFWNFGNSILGALASLRRIFFKNIVFFILTIAGGVVIGVVYSQVLKKKYFKSTMILSCDYFNRRIVESTIEKLNQLCLEKGREGLAKEIGVDIKTAKNIFEFDSDPFVAEQELVDIEVLKEQLQNVASEKKEIVSKVIKQIEIENKSAFRISILVSEPDIVKNLETALVNYFRGNEYIKRRIQIQKSNLLERKQKLISESKKLDTLKYVMFKAFQNTSKQSREGNNNVILSDKYLTDPLNVFKEELNLYKEIQEIEKDLYIQQDFELIDGFTSFKEPEGYGVVQIIIISFFVSILIGYLMIGLVNFDRFLANYKSD